MKFRNILQYLFVFVLVASLFSGCDTWEDDVNIDPNTTSDIDSTDNNAEFSPDQFMQDMIWKTISGWYYINWNVCAAVCEYHGKTISLSQGNRHQAWHDLEHLWTPAFNCALYIKKMKSTATSIKDNRYYAIAQIWECYNFFSLTNLYGDIPYTETMKESPSATPPYDTQESIYSTLMAKLEAASLSISMSDADIDESVDYIYYGNMVKWKKFANTMLIRYAMYMSDAAPDSAKAVLNRILNNPSVYPIMESNADNAKFNFDGVNYKSQMYQLSKAKIEEAPFSNIFIERLISLEDPRLPVFARPVQYQHTDPTLNSLPTNAGTDKYAGHLYGITSDNAYASLWNGGASYASKLGNHFRKEDEKGQATSESATYPLDLATYPEMLFFLAEAREKGWISTSTAKSYYESAVRASFEQYSISFTSSGYIGAFGNSALASVDEYLAQPDVNYEGGRGKDTLIAEQKWIASFMLSFEPYFEHRRTMLPALRASSGAEAYSNTGSSTKFPSRAAYPNSEFSTNSKNVTNACLTGYDIQIVDDKTKNTALMWLLKPKGQTWLQMPVFKEPEYKAQYPAVSTDAEYGTSFYNWYTQHWNTMFWWK